MESSSYSLYSRKKVWDKNAELRKKEEMKKYTKYTKGTLQEHKSQVSIYHKVTITIGG